MATSPGYPVPRQVVEQFIANAARERGIDPNIALEVYRREGAGGWQSGVVKNGIREPSYGPFQLYTGGGLGNKFQKDTGLDPRDPSTWQQNVTYALDEAKKGGWGPWYGAKAAGITGFAGINGAPVTQTAQASPQPGQQQQPSASPSFDMDALLKMVAQQQPAQAAQAPSPMQMAAPQQPQQMAQRRPLDLSGLASMLSGAPPEIRNLILQG